MENGKDIIQTILDTLRPLQHNDSIHDLLIEFDKFISSFVPKGIKSYFFEKNNTYSLPEGEYLKKSDVESLIFAYQCEAYKNKALILGYEEAAEDCKRMIRALDIALNGDNAAKQASLCDIVAQIENTKRHS